MDAETIEPGTMVCPQCHGEGTDPSLPGERCPECDGAGVVANQEPGEVEPSEGEPEAPSEAPAAPSDEPEEVAATDLEVWEPPAAGEEGETAPGEPETHPSGTPPLDGMPKPPWAPTFHGHRFGEIKLAFSGGAGFEITTDRDSAIVRRLKLDRYGSAQVSFRVKSMRPDVSYDREGLPKKVLTYTLEVEGVVIDGEAVG